MIQSLQLKNFKSHKDTLLQLGNLTLLCGQNGGGKSSVIQSLLLLRQTHQKNRLHVGLSLNKPLCYVDKGKDVLYQYAENDNISFSIEIDNHSLAWRFDAENHLASDFIKIDTNQQEIIAQTIRFLSQNQVPLFTEKFQYIGAGRTADYESDDYVVDIQKQLSIEEGKAELTAHFLFKNQSKKVLPEFFQPEVLDSDNLLDHVTAWEREISEGVNIIPKKVGTSYEIRYSFETSRGPTDEFSAKNVGFGLSYALPIIVAILAAEKDSLIIIENPEAHLHPYGQAKLAELMSIAAQAGIQIIVETHSDHIVNGTLVAVKQAKINSEKVKIYHLERDTSEHCTKAIPVEVLSGGRIKHAPTGFFDQIGKHLRILMRPTLRNHE